MKNRLFNYIVFLVVILFVLTFCYPFYDYYNKPIKSVSVEYVVFTPCGQYYRSSNYEMKGNTFHSRLQSHNGINYVSVVDDDAWVYLNKQSVCVYSGTNDCIISKISVR